MAIHPTAVIDPKAELDSSVEVGPYSVIGPNVRIGARTRIASHVVIEGHTTIGEDNNIFQFASLGGMPQDMKFAGETTYLEIGERTGASTATISRVNRSLNYGEDGYDLVLRRLQES